MQRSRMTCPGSPEHSRGLASVKAALFARRVRGRRALTLAFAPRLTIQLSGGCQISSFTNRAPRRVEPLLMATVRLHIETVQKTAVGGDLALEKDGFKQGFSYEHENHYVERPAS